MNFDPDEAANYKSGETGYVELDAELGGSDVDDKLMEVGSDICMSDGGEMINFYDEKEFSSQDLHANVEPCVGMEFNSEEAAMAYYDAYAKRVGFIIRIGNCHRSSHDGSVISRRFVCNKEGFRVNKKVKRVEVRKPRAVTREGCKAMIMVRKEKSGTWILAKLETQHSHPLGISLGKVRSGPVRAQSQREIAYMASIYDQPQPTPKSKFKTSTHITALDGIVNVNSLFTVAIFIGFSLTEPSSSAAGQRRSCNAGVDVVRRLIVYEVISFSWFLFSSLIAQALKLYINLLNNSDRSEAHKADVDRRLLKTGLLGSALGSLLGSIFLMFSISNFIQVKLGVFACGGKTIWSVVTLAVCVGSALIVYFVMSLYMLFYV